MNVEPIIINFNTLNEQFSWGHPTLIGAKELKDRLAKKLNETIKDNSISMVYSIPCNENSEAEAQFRLVAYYVEINIAHFEYIGTAN